MNAAKKMRIYWSEEGVDGDRCAPKRQKAKKNVKASYSIQTVFI